MAKIYRYEIEKVDDNGIAELELPAGARVLSVGLKPGDARYSLWALVDPTSPKKTQRIRFMNTGGEDLMQPDHWRFVSQIMHGRPGGVLVFHVFVEEVLLA